MVEIDLTKYDELLQQARAKTFEIDKARAAIAKEYVPQLYWELRNQKLDVATARYKVE